MKKILYSYVQPAMVVAVLFFWAFAPKAWVESPWSLTIATSVVTLLVLLFCLSHRSHTPRSIDL